MFIDKSNQLFVLKFRARVNKITPNILFARPTKYVQSKLPAFMRLYVYNFEWVYNYDTFITLRTSSLS